MLGAVCGLLVAVLGMVPWYFTVETLVSLLEFGHLFFRVVLSEANGVNIHVVSSLRGGFLPIIVGIPLDSKGFVESSAIIIFEGDLFLPFAMLFDCFLGPAFKVLRVLGGGIIDVGVNYGVEESFF